MAALPVDLEQVLFDALAFQLGEIDDLLAARDAVANLPKIAAHCDAAAAVARAAQLVLGGGPDGLTDQVDG